MCSSKKIINNSSLDMEIERHIISVKLLGKEKKDKKTKAEYAIEVVLSDESTYTIYRTKKQIASFNHKLINRFPVEAGYFSEREKILPDCPFKKTPFGIKQCCSNEAQVGRVLNSYLKGLAAVPSKIIKCDIMLHFTALWTTDLEMIDQNTKKSSKLPKRRESLHANSTNTISKPMKLKSYITVANFTSKNKFSFKKDMVVQVVQKDSSGWWLIDVHGQLGWAPASYLVLKDDDDTMEEENENKTLIQQDRIGARYISTCSYKATRDDEISFMTGAIVRVTRKCIDGWWIVRYNGREGVVPGLMFKKFDRRQATAYVKNIKKRYSRRRNSTVIKPTIQTNWQKDSNTEATNEEQNNVQLYECTKKFIGDFEKFQLSINSGDMVRVLDMRDNGWWYVRDWHGRTGWVPSSYLKDVHNDEPVSSVGVGSKCTVISSFDSQCEKELTVKEGDTVFVVTMSEDGWWKVQMANDPQREGIIPSVCLKVFDEDYNADDIVLDDSNDWLEDSDDIQDCYVIVKSYERVNADEIDATEGEIVCIIDHTHKDTWYVEIDGREGWIPSDILRPITEEELLSANNSPSTPLSPNNDDTHEIITNSVNNTMPTDTSSTNYVPINDETDSITKDHKSPTSSSLPTNSSSETPMHRKGRISLVDDGISSIGETPPLPSEIISERKITLSTSSSSDNIHHHLRMVSVSPDDDNDDDGSVCITSDSEESDFDEDLTELQKAVEEAERIANEAKEKVATLKKKVEEKKRTLMRDQDKNPVKH